MSSATPPYRTSARPGPELQLTSVDDMVAGGAAALGTGAMIALAPAALIVAVFSIRDLAPMAIVWAALASYIAICCWLPYAWMFQRRAGSSRRSRYVVFSRPMVRSTWFITAATVVPLVLFGCVTVASSPWALVLALVCVPLCALFAPLFGVPRRLMELAIGFRSARILELDDSPRLSTLDGSSSRIDEARAKDGVVEVRVCDAWTPLHVWGGPSGDTSWAAGCVERIERG